MDFDPLAPPCTDYHPVHLVYWGANGCGNAAQADGWESERAALALALLQRAQA